VNRYKRKQQLLAERKASIEETKRELDRIRYNPRNKIVELSLPLVNADDSIHCLRSAMVREIEL
jgi:hypothetical protein